MEDAGDLFRNGDENYSARNIEILQGLEPVRRRPGMYIGGTDERALHHLVAEVLDNSMDEAVAGHASRIGMELNEDGSVSIQDNGRGIPVDDHPHPDHKGKSALEVILTVLHAGGKFGDESYQTSGGLNGVGVSVVNALSENLAVEVVRGQKGYRQIFERGVPKTRLEKLGDMKNRRGTKVTFTPDSQIFGENARFDPDRLYRMARSKGYLFRGVKIRWKCPPELIGSKSETPSEDKFHFPAGLTDFLLSELKNARPVTPEPFAGEVRFADVPDKVEWAITWIADREPFVGSYCNTVPTPQGGTHEVGLRHALTRGLKNYGQMSNVKKASIITGDDVMSSAGALLSIFIREPEFQGQTKDKLATMDATRLVENSIRDRFDHWLTGHPAVAGTLLRWTIDKAEERMARRKEKEVNRKAAVRKLRLPGKLVDCTSDTRDGTELFVVEGDSAGGTAKPARNRKTQAVFPLKGKILNVANAGAGKLQQNKELADLVQALGCGTGAKYREEDLRYDKVIIMTDADVDGAHIASLLMTFFYKELRQAIENGHLYLALPPLYKLSNGTMSVYARDDVHRDELIKSAFKANARVEISRFKGLGEMMAAQLKETTMDSATRNLIKVTVPQAEAMATGDLVERLMGKKAEHRFDYITENAEFVTDLDV